VYLIGFLLLILLLGGCKADGDRWEQIAESGVLRVGLDPTYPPFAVADGDEVYGLDIDLAEALAQEMGLEPQFTYFGYDGLYDALTTGQVDTLISALVVAPERTRDIAYTTSYFDAGQFLVVPIDDHTIAGMVDLAGQTLAVEQGALGHVTALEWQRRLPDMAIAPYPSVDAALEAVADDSAAAALVDHVGARLFMRQATTKLPSPLKLLPDAVVSEPYVVAVRNGDRTLREKMSAGIEKFAKAGVLDQMVDRWLGD
jgi:polar amino acid transport system substrate-binding protein